MKWFLSVLLLIGSVGMVAGGADSAGAGGDDTIGLLIGVLKDTADPAAQADLLKGMNAAMEGKKNVKMPVGWQDVYAKLAQSPNAEVKKEAQKLSAVFGDAGTLDAIRNIVLDPSKSADERNRALQSLINKGDASLP